MQDLTPFGFSAPPEAAPTRPETRDAKHDLAQGVPVLFGSVFVAFVVVVRVSFLVR